MNFLLDTCVLSEFVKVQPDEKVVRWFTAQAMETLYISSITVGEIQHGISLLGDTRRARRLRIWFEEDIVDGFGDRVIPFTAQIARPWGGILAASRHSDHPLPILDSMIAATAIAHGMTLVTRNVSDMDIAGLPLVNPFE